MDNVLIYKCVKHGTTRDEILSHLPPYIKWNKKIYVDKDNLYDPVVSLLTPIDKIDELNDLKFITYYTPMDCQYSSYDYAEEYIQNHGCSIL